MSKIDRIFLLKNLVVYSGLVVVGMICNLFLDFNSERGNMVLFLVLALSALFISFLTDHVAKKTGQESLISRLPSVFFPVVLFWIFRWFPGLLPNSLTELILFLTILFAAVVMRHFYVEGKRKPK